MYKDFFSKIHKFTKRNYLARVWASKTYNKIRESGKSVLTYLPGAKEFARKAEKYDLFWFEEPVEPDDYIGQAEITRSTSIPIAAGENEYTRYGFRDMINHRAVDILQPDCLILGGVTEFMKVCALAQSNDLDIAPHGAQEVHIHLVSAIPNGLILEYYRDTVNPMHGKIWENELVLKDGYVYAPDLPGFGLTPKWKDLEPYRV